MVFRDCDTFVFMDGRFVILLHTGFGQDHYDLMLSEGDSLATWQFGQNPAILSAGGSISGIRLPDHRVEYLDYEGTVGGDRGQVARIDGGTVRGDYIADERRHLTFQGCQMEGEFILCRLDSPGKWDLLRPAGK